MATVNLRLNNAVVFDITKFGVKLGETFQLELVDQETETEWYSKADEVLDIQQNGNTALIEATAKGPTKIKIFDDNDSLVMEIEVEVLESIPSPATDLGLKAGKPELKPSK